MSVPGVIAMRVAPLVAQLSVLLDPELMLAGVALKDRTEGAEPVPGRVVVASGLLVEPPQLVRAIQASKPRAIAQRSSAEQLRAELASRLAKETGEPKCDPLDCDYIHGNCALRLL